MYQRFTPLGRCLRDPLICPIHPHCESWNTQVSCCSFSAFILTLENEPCMGFDSKSRFMSQIVRMCATAITEHKHNQYNICVSVEGSKINTMPVFSDKSVIFNITYQIHRMLLSSALSLQCTQVGIRMLYLQYSVQSCMHALSELKSELTMRSTCTYCRMKSLKGHYGDDNYILHCCMRSL